MLRGGEPRSWVNAINDRVLGKFLRGFLYLFFLTVGSSVFAGLPHTPVWKKIKTHCKNYAADCELGFQLLEDLRHNRITDQEAERQVSDHWKLPVKLDAFHGPRMESWSFEAEGHYQFYLSWSRNFDTNEIQMSVALFYMRPLQSVLDFDYDEKIQLQNASFSEFQVVGTREIEKIVDAGGDIIEILHYKDPAPLPLSQIYPKGFAQPEKIILVGMVDSGVDYNHPAIAKQILRDVDKSGKVIGIGKDFYDEDNFAFDLTAGDVRNHGTSVASVIVSHSPHIMILPLRYTDSMDLREVIRYGHKRGVRIFNFSLGFVEEGYKSDNLKTTIRETAELYPDTLFVWAAGNELTNLDEYPQMKDSLLFSNVVYVASVDKNFKLDASDPGGSNFGRDTVDFAHFGVDQNVATPGNLYAKYSGTSFAAPQVAGLAAVLKLKNPNLQGSELADALRGLVKRQASLDGLLKSPGVPMLKNLN